MTEADAVGEAGSASPQRTGTTQSRSRYERTLRPLVVEHDSLGRPCGSNPRHEAKPQSCQRIAADAAPRVLAEGPWTQSGSGQFGSTSVVAAAGARCSSTEPVAHSAPTRFTAFVGFVGKSAAEADVPVKWVAIGATSGPRLHLIT